MPRCSAPRRRSPGRADARSRPRPRRRAQQRSSSPGRRTAATTGWPFVSVPVLSKMTTSSSRARSSAIRSLTSSPFRAPSEVEIAMTSGIARPSACGQAMTSTVAVRTSAPSGSPEQPPDDERDDAGGEGDVEEDRRGAVGQGLRPGRRRLRGGDQAHDPRQRRLSPTAVTRTRRLPPAATVPAMTLSPGSFATGSRLAGDHRLVDVGLARRPPCRRRGPGRRAARARCRRRASVGERHRLGAARRSPARPYRAEARPGRASAPRAWAIERISSQWPSSMIVIRVASSHQISTSNSPSVPAQRVTKATTIASEIRVIIPGWRSRSSPARAADEDQAAVEEDDRAEDGGHVLDARDRRRACSRAIPGCRRSSRTTGIVSARLSQNLSRNIATEWPACLSWPPVALAVAGVAQGTGCEAGAPRADPLESRRGRGKPRRARRSMLFPRDGRGPVH